MRMCFTFVGLFLVCAQTLVKSNEIRENNLETENYATQLKNVNTGQNVTTIISHVFCEACLPAKDTVFKRNLDEVHTYAELKNDFRASLPASFTICSTLLVTNGRWQLFFNLVGEDGGELLAPWLYMHDKKENMLQIYFRQGSTKPTYSVIPPIFANQWLKSCLAINTTSGWLGWVVEGTLVIATSSEEVRGHGKMPTNLTQNLILGAHNYAGKWYAFSNKVTNLNIFSSVMAVDKMKSMTKGGKCVEEGDYLAWRDMEWTLHGEAVVEIVEKEIPCKGDPFANLYNTPYPRMEYCMQHCENLGSRAPSVTTLDKWNILKNFLKKELYDKVINSPVQIWLSISDRWREGVWQDFYSKEVVENYTSQIFQPDGGTVQSCARQFSEEVWADAECDYPGYVCLCERYPKPYLTLRGLSTKSAVHNVLFGQSYTPVVKNAL